ESIVASGDRLYCPIDGNLYCLDAARGTVIKVFDGVPAPRYLMMSGNTLIGGTGFRTYGSDVYVIDAETGQRIWKGRGKTPVAAENRMFCCGDKNEVFSLDLKTGKEVWRVELQLPLAQAKGRVGISHYAHGRVILENPGDKYHIQALSAQD